MSNTDDGPTHIDIRRRLVNAGVELVDESGTDAVGLRAITRRAGVSHGAPRRHFPTHRALMAAIARTGIDDLTDIVDPILVDDSRTPRERLVGAGTAYVDYARRRRSMFELMFRHDILDGAGENLRELTLPLAHRLHQTVCTAAGFEVDWAHTIGLWAGLHGIAVLTANRSLEPLDTLAPIEVSRLVIDAVDAALRPR